MLKMDLQKAIESGDFPRVQELLQQNVDLNIHNVYGDTPLMIAIYFNQEEIVEELLRHGAIIDYQAEDGRTALTEAIGYGRKNIVKILLQYQPNIDLQNQSGWTPLLYAVVGRNQDIVEMLLQQQPDVNLQNNNGQTALMFPAAYNNQKMVETLLQQGALVNIKDKENKTAITLARANGHEHIVKMLEEWLELSQSNPDDVRPDGTTNLMLMASQGNLGIIRSYFPKIHNINYHDPQGRTALFYAIDSGNALLVAELIQRGASRDLPDHKGYTSFHYLEASTDPIMKNNLY